MTKNHINDSSSSSVNFLVRSDDETLIYKISDLRYEEEQITCVIDGLPETFDPDKVTIFDDYQEAE